MGRKKDSLTWEHFEQIDGISKCKYCGAEFKGKPSAMRLRKHLLGVQGAGISSCKQVPDHVKNVLADDSLNETLNEDIQVLIRKAERLSSRAEDINITLEILESRTGKKRKREVENWLTNVQRMKNEVEQIAKEVQESSYFMPASLRRRVEKNIQEAAELVEQGSFPDGIVLRDANQSKGEELITVPLVGQTTAKRNFEKIWGCLMNEDTLSIGVYGMGGVGKTTIVTHIHNRLLKVDSSFDNVYWVTVSQQSSIFKLQSDISKAVGLDLSMEMDEKKRAAKLFHKLERCKKFVLILDDMWEKFPVENVGVPLRVNGGKLLLTTRSLKVCKEMECEEIINVEPLSEIESWELFLTKIGPDNVHSPLIEDIAKSMVKECAGLPLAIVSVANSTRRLEKDYEWRDALNELNKNSKGLNEMAKECAGLPCSRVPDDVKKAHADPSITNSTSVPRDNNKSENLVQDGELMQPVVQEQPLSEKEARSDHKLSDDSSNPADTGSKEEKEHEMSRKKDEICMEVPDYVIKSFAVDLKKTSLIESRSSNNERINSISTSTRQENNQISNLVHSGEMMQLLVQDRGQQPFGGDEMIEKMTSLPFLTAEMVGHSIKENLDTVWKWLISDEVSTIGIYGMGGVGKTTLVTHIHNRILEHPSIFQHVYWVTVSQDFSVFRLQAQIAQAIGLYFGNEDNVWKRAARLFEELRRKWKFVLILDDLWNHFDVKRAGIPVEVNGCKLIVTSRSLDVCRRINCQKKMVVLPLSDQEAWKLFVQTLGHDMQYEVEQIAKCMARECSGLPLAIVTMAGSMRCVDDIHVWRNALAALQSSDYSDSDMEPEVMQILRFSYNSLDRTLQNCLLYCALFPESFLIKREELIKHLIVEGIIERTDSRQAAFDKGHAMLNKLQNASLLEYVDGGSVKMHVLIRDMTLGIMKECSPSLVVAGKHLTNLPEQQWWTKDIRRVSLMNNDIKLIHSHHIPECPYLSTLLLCRNYELEWIEESFLSQLHGLKVLDLSETAIRRLPISVTGLENLTALFLRKCWNLRDIPSLANLVALQELDLFGCRKLEQVPEDLDLLPNLKCINLSLTGIKKLPAGIFTERFQSRLLSDLSSEDELVRHIPSQPSPQGLKPP